MPRRAIPYTTLITGDTDTHRVYNVGPANDYGLGPGAAIPAPISGLAIPYWSDTGGHSVMVQQNDWTFHAQHHARECYSGKVDEGDILGHVGATGSMWFGYHSHQYIIASGKRFSMEDFFSISGFVGGTYKTFVQPFLTSQSGTIPKDDIMTPEQQENIKDATRRDARYRLYQCTEHPNELMGVNWHMPSNDVAKVCFPVGPDQVRRLYLPYQMMGDAPQQARQVSHGELRNTYRLATGIDGIFKPKDWVSPFLTD